MCACVRSIKGAKGATHTAGAAIFTDFPSDSFRLFLQCAAIYVFIHCAFCCRFSFCFCLLSLSLMLCLLLSCRQPVAHCPLPACLLRNCWKMVSQFRLGLILTIALAFLPSLCLLSLFSFFEFAFWFSFCLQSREIKLFCPFSAFSCYCCCHIGFYLSYCHGL